jgi:hypothetical protein
LSRRSSRGTTEPPEIPANNVLHPTFAASS